MRSEKTETVGPSRARFCLLLREREVERARTGQVGARTRGARRPRGMRDRSGPWRALQSEDKSANRESEGWARVGMRDVQTQCERRRRAEKPVRRGGGA